MQSERDLHEEVFGADGISHQQLPSGPANDGDLGDGIELF
jgi:hypothetical protein